MEQPTNKPAYRSAHIEELGDISSLTQGGSYEGAADGEFVVTPSGPVPLFSGNLVVNGG